MLSPIIHPWGGRKLDSGFFFNLSLPPEDVEESSEDEDNKDDTGDGATDDGSRRHGLGFCGKIRSHVHPTAPQRNPKSPNSCSSPSGNVSNSCSRLKAPWPSLVSAWTRTT